MKTPTTIDAREQRSAQVSTEAEEVLDHTYVRQLRLLGGDEPESQHQITSLISAFIDQSRAQIEAAEAMIAESDFEGLASLAHGMKGSSGNFGAKHFATVMADLEDVAQRRDSEAAIALTRQAREAFAAVSTALETEFVAEESER